MAKCEKIKIFKWEKLAFFMNQSAIHTPIVKDNHIC